MFLSIEIPDSFVLECRTGDGGWAVHGAYGSSDFQRLPDGTYVCAGHGGSPLFLRSVRQDGQVLQVVDGGGREFTYRLVPCPDPTPPA